MLMGEFGDRWLRARQEPDDPSVRGVFQTAPCGAADDVLCRRWGQRSECGEGDGSAVCEEGERWVCPTDNSLEK